MTDNESLTGRTFTRTRRKDGYVVEEVDRFVAEVAEALAERDRTISELEGDVTAWRMRLQETRDRREAPPAQEPQQAAARLLELAAANADKLAAESAAEAERLVTGARSEAERLTSEARAEVERLRRLERDHREHLRRHFTEQLAELDEAAPPLRAVD